MKITSIDIHSVYRGLPPVKMSGLKDVVLLAGPNGGGKSRLLQAVGNYARAFLTPEEVARQHEAINNIQQNIESYEHQATHLLDKGVNDHRVADLQRYAAASRDEITTVRQVLQDGEIVKTEPVGRKPIVVDYRVNKLDLKDSREFKISDMLQSGSHMASDFNVGLSPEYGLAAIHELLYLHVHEEDAALKAALAEKVSRLKQLIKDLLDTELGYSGKLGPTLFGKPISETGLSQGQVVLLQIVMSLFFQDGSAEDLILLLDEPEVHLHPIAVLQLLDHLRASCPHAQIWIATHSLHLLAHFDQEFVWFVKDGVVQKAGSKRLEVLHSLVGDERGVDELSAFLTLPVKSAALSFAAQCMLAPNAVDTPAGDPQTSQIRDVIHSLLKSSDPIRLLDFGMGKGRLLAELEANAASSAESLVRGIDYYGFDAEACPEDQELCRTRLARLFAESDARYSTTVKELRGLNRNSIHLVVMCNVLHEVPPDQWSKVFGKDGYLTDLLDPDGFLLIVEDQLLKVGERAHAFGFLVLSSVELRILFGCEQEDRAFITLSHPQPRYADRLKAHLVPARLVANLTPQSAHKAISELKANALREVQRLQGEQYSNIAAREYAFWSHQFVNASLALG